MPRIRAMRPACAGCPQTTRGRGGHVRPEPQRLAAPAGPASGGVLPGAGDHGGHARQGKGASVVSTATLVADVVTSFKASGRIVIVGASIAGLRGAEALRNAGFNGKLTIIGDEAHEPYDRPPLSKQVLRGWVPATHTKLPRAREVNAEWRLGVAATGLDRKTKTVRLANGDEVPYDRLLIATGVRSRPWFNKVEAALEGVFTIRTANDAGQLQAALAAKPRRGLVVW